MKIGLIAGSGFYNIDWLGEAEELTISTPYGEPSDKYFKYSYGEHEIYFLPRHGLKHDKAPHSINYRANIHGFKELGVERIIAFTATGGINGNFAPGDIVITDNAIDFTSGRASTYFDNDEIYHVDLTSPFCPDTRKKLLHAAKKADVKVHKAGVYVCTNGPRYETAAEIMAYKILGADMVGMTIFPECTLARELQICYASVSVITNYAAGVSNEPLDTDHVTKIMAKSNNKLKDIFKKYLKLDTEIKCGCHSSLEGNKISK
ncbi:MAG: S-methyl-5'-thioadenosine phosphorylase [Deferribacteraceae bacterium]|jgi:5'-methylthioadenosine phosphorylase|nr:S-methyl-5'-thioadenosine phosphorylase [Deferribacteraceae bacterium]